MTTLSSDKPSIWQRSIMRRFLKWLFSWRTARRALIDVAVLATLVALVIAEEDWRGKHAWEKFKHEWEAKGERFDRASVVSSPVPDDKNFALTPIVASSYLHVLDKSGHEIRPAKTNVVNRLKMERGDNNNWPTSGVGNWQKSTATNLKALQQYYRAKAAKTNEFPVALEPQTPAADVLLALSKYDSDIEELRQASQLPYSRFPLEYDKDNPCMVLLPHLNALRGCARVLQLRAIAELELGQTEKALADVKLMLRLVDAIRTEPVLISHLVRIAIVDSVNQPIWEGLAEHKWSDAQLVELDRELAKLNFLSDYKLAMRSELVFQGGIFDYWRRHPEQLLNMYGEGGPSRTVLARARIVLHLIPSGWFYQNQLRCARLMVEHYLPIADLNQGIISPAATRRAGAAVEADTKHLSPYNVFERLLLPALGAATKKFAYGQEAGDLARVGIALERYRLAHGEYPESLNALAPQFIAKLPHDVINGQPLKYRRTDGGQFVLYSVGWNEKDDGGEVGLGESGAVDISTGDWVWKYPAKSSAQ
jgi:hypothetical protein